MVTPSAVGAVQIEMEQGASDPVTFMGIVFNNGSQWSSSAEILNCLFTGITAVRYSAVYALGSNIRIYNDRNSSTLVGFYNNSASQLGTVGIAVLSVASL